MKWEASIAKGKKSGGKSFQVGNNANPKGGGALSPTVRSIRKITLDHIEEVADIILDSNLAKLKALAENPDTSVLKVWIAKGAAEGIRKGDLGNLETILNRVMGKPKERFEHSGPDGGAIPTEIVYDTQWRDTPATDQADTPALPADPIPVKGS